ncbi:MAG TPA: hypothetical protein VFO39_08185 [Candidatus Sulfotelmatobacter sp.]|nr:hypothetical protein [Candidatus Sulfotelmatobacter sp.]
MARPKIDLFLPYARVIAYFDRPTAGTPVVFVQVFREMSDRKSEVGPRLSVMKILAHACLFAAIAVALPGCKSRRAPTADTDLRAKIVRSNFAQYCHSTETGCVNPSILAIDDGLFVTDFSSGKAHHSQVSPESLAGYLISLPPSAWPRGPSIILTPSDDVISSERVNHNLNEAVRICKSLHLDTEVRPGG